MMDANLCGTPKGSAIYVKFIGSASKFGDTTNILAGTYECLVVSDTSDTPDAMVITVYNPMFRKAPTIPSLCVCEADIGDRWVTYEGHIK